MKTNWHPLLRREMKKAGLSGTEASVDGDVLRRLLASIDRSYRAADDDRYLLERSLEISSLEMAELNERIAGDRDRLSKILATLSDGLIHVEGGWRASFANRKAEEILGWTTEDLGEESVLEKIEIKDEGNARSLRGACEEARRRGKSISWDCVTLRSKSGRRVPVSFAMCLVTSVRTEGSVPDVVFVFRDLTEKRRFELDLQKARIDAEAARREERTKNEFLANISHELRTPMHGILSFTRFGLDSMEGKRSDSPRVMKRSLEMIQKSADRLLRLINELLDLSKSQAGKMEFRFRTAPLHGLVRTICDELRPLREEKEILLSLAEPMSSELVRHDADRMLQVLRNLIGNAIKFSDDGGEIEIGLITRDGKVRLSVGDRGPGIPGDERESIFEKFTQSSRTKAGSGGTGLGLSICREIVDAHGGRIWVEDNSGGGAVFQVELPVSEDGIVDTRGTGTGALS